MKNKDTQKIAQKIEQKNERNRRWGYGGRLGARVSEEKTLKTEQIYKIVDSLMLNIWFWECLTQ
jgi:hypothetical protein